MPKQLLATFPTRDIADSVKDRFLADGFAPHALIVMANTPASEPPEAADLEVGKDNEGGFAGLEEKVGKAVRSLLGKHDRMDGDLSEGEPTGGALLAVTVDDDAAESKARALFTAHRAGDIEVAEAD